ncbi:hypothetical protein D3C80_1809230 [compost metagenome]
MACAGIANPAIVMLGAEAFFGFGFIHVGHVWIVITLDRNLDAFAVMFFISLFMGDIELAGQIFHINAVGCGEIQNVMFGIFRQIEQTLGTLVADLFFELIRP